MLVYGARTDAPTWTQGMVAMKRPKQLPLFLRNLSLSPAQIVQLKDKIKRLSR